MTNQLAVQAFDKARNQAYWSYIGLIIPIAGIILGFLSRARLRELVGGTPDEQYEINRTANIALWGVIVSFVTLLLAIIGYAMWQHDTNQAIEQTQQMLLR